MATLALAAVVPAGFWGSALGWQALAYGLTAYIDNRFVMRAMFPPPDAPKPTVGDFHLLFAEEGSPIPYVSGEAPVTGGVIWTPQLPIFEPIDAPSGGCGGPSQTIGYNIFRHVQIVLAGCDPVDGVDGVPKMWRDGKVFWEENPDVNITSSQITAAIYYEITNSGTVQNATNTSPVRLQALHFSVANGQMVRVSGVGGNTGANGDWVVANLSLGVISHFDLVGSVGTGTYTPGTGTVGRLRSMLELQSPSTGPDLRRVRIGVNATISGFTAPATANNGTWRCIAHGSITGGGTYARFDVNPPAPVAKAAGDPVHIVQDVPQFKPGTAVSVEFTLGGASEVPHPLPESVEGVGNVPAYRGRVTTVIEKLSCDQSGRIGEFKALVRTKAGTFLLADAIAVECERAGLTSSEYDVEDVDGEFTGVAIETGPHTPLDVVHPVVIANDVLAQQVDDKVRFFSRTNATVYPVIAADLGAHADGDAYVDVLDAVDPPDSVLPDEVNVSYFDPAMDWQTRTQRERKDRSVAGREVTQLKLPVVLEGIKGRGLARKTLWRTWGARQQLSFSLPQSYCYLREGHVVTFDAYGESWRVLLRKVDVGVNFMVRCEGEIDDPVITAITDGPAEDPGGDGPPTVGLPGEVALILANLSPQETGHVGRIGFYSCAALEDADEFFSAITLYDSNDGSIFAQIADFPGEATMGIANTALSGSGFDVAFFDMKNTVDVTVKDGTLSSSTRALVLRGANQGLLGNEWISWITATLIDTNKYRLSGLLRGRHNTQDQTGFHMPGERFSVYTPLRWRFVEKSLADAGDQRHYRAIPPGGSVTQATDHLFTMDLTISQHWTPCQPKMQWDSATGDLLLRWRRRCLGPVRILGSTVPLYDTQELYEVEVYDDNTFTTLLRTLTVSDVSEVEYTAADQTSDFGSVQTSLNFVVYQTHAVGGRSKPLRCADFAYTSAI